MKIAIMLLKKKRKKFKTIIVKMGKEFNLQSGAIAL